MSTHDVINEAVHRVFVEDKRTRDVVLGYVATQRPVVIEDMTPNPEYCAPDVEPVGAWSQHAPPSQGWVPSTDAMVKLVNELASMFDVYAAKQILLHFRDHDIAEHERACAVLDSAAPPQRYEEHGEIEGMSYYYVRDVYPALGLTIHRDSERITNVEFTGIDA